MSWQMILKFLMEYEWEQDPNYPNINVIVHRQITNTMKRERLDRPTTLPQHIVKMAIRQFGEGLEQDIEKWQNDGYVKGTMTKAHRDFDYWIRRF